MLIITGAEQGLGAELMHQADQAGYDVVNLPGKELKTAAKYYIDEFIKGMMGEVTYVINNYGINHLSKIGETPVEDHAIININLLAPYWMVNALIANGHGPCRVINVASATYRVPQTCTSLYCASKAGLVQMTKVMARELAKDGWVINAVAPGYMPGTRMSDMTNEQILELRGWTQEEADSYAERLIPMRRFTSTEEVAEAILKVFELPDYINGTCIDIMGGV